jgi:hypothetical protein
MRRELLGLAVLVATLWSVWQLAGVQRAMSQQARSPQQRKLQEADRIVHYRFDREHGPVFHLDGNETELRLVTHLVLGAGRVYLADQTYDYGLRLRIDGPDGNQLWQRDIHTSTRQSKAEWDGDEWMHENAFGLEPGTEVTDDRVHLVTLPRDLPWGSRFHVRLEAPAASYGLLRAYERARDSSIGLAMAYFGPAPGDAERLVGNLTYLPWEVLTEEQRTKRLELRWNRLSAIGELGTDYEVDTIFYSGFRALPAELPPPPPVTLVDDRATALTAFGPGVLNVWIHADCSALGPEAPAPAVEVVHVEATGIVDVRHVDPCTGEGFEAWLPEGPHTLHVRGRDLPETVVQAWYHDHLRPALELPGLELGRPLLPTITRSPRVRLASGSVPAEYALVEPEDLESAMLELRAQLLVPPRSAPAAQRPATLRYAFTDRHGQVLDEGQWRIEPAEQLERYEQVVDASDSAQQWWVSPYRVARIIAPEGTHHLRLEADGELIASVFTYWRGTLEAPRPQPPYDEFILVGTRWRRVPRDHQRWFMVDPENAHVLQRHGQTVDIHGPIRLELVGGDEAYTGDDGEAAEAEPLLVASAAPTESQWVSLLPYTVHEHRTVLERTPPGSPWARYVRWQPGRATLPVDDDWGATLVYLVDGDPALALGKEIEVTIDGQVLRTTILSTRDAWTLPGLGRGTHALELGELPEGVRVYLDRPRLRPESGVAETYRVITIHRLAGKRMGLLVDKTGEGRDYVNALTYRCGEHEPSRLRVELDRGTPERQRGVVVDRVTTAVRERTLPAHGEPAELVFLDRPQEPCEALGRVPIPLGPDLARGRHRVDLYVEDGPGLWVRFFRRGTAEVEGARAREWTERVLDLREEARAP